MHDTIERLIDRISYAAYFGLVGTGGAVSMSQAIDQAEQDVFKSIAEINSLAALGLDFSRIRPRVATRVLQLATGETF